MKLSNANGSEVISALTKKELPFRISFETSLDNGYELKDMRLSHIKEFHRFVTETIYKKLTISQVDKLYLRKRGLSSKIPKTLHENIELIHYGKSNNPFRLFGYYNQDAYFVVCRIDGGHDTHQ